MEKFTKGQILNLMAEYVGESDEFPGGYHIVNVKLDPQAYKAKKLPGIDLLVHETSLQGILQNDK